MTSQSIDINAIERAFFQPVQSSTLTRWERKALQKKASKTPRANKGDSDRFIPNRDSSHMNIQMHHMNDENANCNAVNQADFNNKLAQSLFETDNVEATRILAFKQKAPKPTEGHHNNMRVLYTQNRSSLPNQKKKSFRHIDKTPERILDAPDLVDDYYLNLLDWSVGNVMAVALGPAVYLWNASSGTIDLLCEADDEENNVTSISFMGDGTHVAIGNNNSKIELWDIARKTKVRTMGGHTARVSSLAWNNHVLSSGSRDSSIINHDVRIQQHVASRLRGHEQEVCGLAWSPDGTQLASGANDNKCCIWDINQETARFTLTESNAAVKALAWCPFERNILATGAGTADRHIRFYNSLTGSCINQVDTGSQVCSLVWSQSEKELLSGHGYSENQLTLWNYPTMTRVAELTGHSQRVLHMALSADGSTVCSAAADETLRFWKIWDHPALKKKSSSSSSSSSSRNKSIMRTLR
jgi:cell division cycle protein 20 (cofactor of APC complex)